MAIDVSEIKRKLEALKNNKSLNSSSESKLKFWKPEGDGKIRFIVKPDNDDPVKEYNWHYPKKGTSFLCNKKSYGHESCPICDAGSFLWNSYVEGGKTNDELKEAAKKLFASPRYYTTVIVRGKENDGVFLYGYGKEVAQDFMTTLVNPDYDNSVLDPQKGRDFDLRITQKAGNGNNTYRSVSITASPKETPILPENSSLSLGELYEEIPDMDHLFKESDEDKMNEVLNEYLDAVMSKCGLNEIGDSSSEEGEPEDALEAAMRKLGA